MINQNNYFDKEKSIDFYNMPDAIKKGHDYVNKATSNGTSWEAYHGSETVKKVMDMYFAKLNEFVANNNKADVKQRHEKVKQQTHQEIIHEAKIKQGIINPDGSPKHTASKKHKAQKEKPTSKASLVERIPEEIRFIRRFINLHGKTKTKDDVLRFINALQKSILEKRIRKTSSYAKEIKYIQESLIKTFNSMRAKMKMEVNDKTYNEFKVLAAGEKVYPSVQLIKKYINLNGKPGMKEKAKQLLAEMERAVRIKKTISKEDPHAPALNKAWENLTAFVKNKSEKVLQIEQKELNGLQGVLNGLDGIDDEPTIKKSAIMNSMDFANMQFETIGLKGKWLNLIGDPSSNFTAMVFGKPKMGKSYLCIDFAGYLARNHGKVLYVAREEGLDMTLQKKLNEKHVQHPNLYVASILPKSLSAYDFIFLDSVNKLGLNPEDLNRLKALNPTKSFVFIFQTTKQGNFRGENSFQHDVDVVIEVPEKGKAVQMGRFNQGGEMEIF
jgi:hypothetical protein